MCRRRWISPGPRPSADPPLQQAEGDAEGEEDQGREPRLRPKSTKLRLPNLPRKRLALGTLLWVVLHFVESGGKQIPFHSPWDLRLKNGEAIDQLLPICINSFE
ncbi:hypothetical protein E2320_007230 [Naja naja]|nr:hypothetical protein E2320_007230 [Naja naja]